MTASEPFAYLQTQYLRNFCSARKTEENIRDDIDHELVMDKSDIHSTSTFLVLDFFFFSDDSWLGWVELPSMDEAILGLDADDAREARARWSWQVQNGWVYSSVGFILVPSRQAQWFGVVYLSKVSLFLLSHNWGRCS